ncbi:Fic family protein [Desulfonatronovibrio magnus]|uniref:Fic family protein n=1 Tax=Desulfonatronovibrio magnus TaxID=698827 RepID=UPI0005EBBF5E|nr:Fic family protein [Desulfonatronovibrio magnus]
MKRDRTGTYFSTAAGGEKVCAFIPDPLPPVPPLSMDGETISLLADAALALGRLSSLRLAPDYNLFLYQYVRKEAVLSSKIEGTQSTLVDLLAHEDDDIPGVPLDDVLEVSNYVQAMEYGKKRLLEDRFPVSSRLIKEIHAVLLTGGRGSDKTPGEFKRTQNWIGGTRPGNASFVPTPPHETQRCMGELDKFINDRGHGLHILVTAGLAHVQFETIHPFLDGNGRIGRMLVPLLLMQEGILDEPCLYLSLYLKRFREEYYARLQAVRMQGDWEGWIKFFLQGVIASARDAVSAAERIMAIYHEDRGHILDQGKSTKAVMRVHECILQRQAANPKKIAALSGLSQPSVMTALRVLESLAIVKESTGRQRNTRYHYIRTCKILNDEIGMF